MALKSPYSAFQKISEELNTGGDAPAILNRVMDIAMETLSAERGFILMRPDNDDAHFEAITARNISNPSAQFAICPAAWSTRCSPAENRL